MYKVVMGIDMGHGEVAAHFMTTNGIVTCILDPDTKDKTIFSAIGYTGNIVKIGRAATNCETCYAYFKASPRNWNEIMPGGDGKKTRKQLLEDFLAQLMKQICELNPELTKVLKDNRGKRGEMLLLVGCPTSSDWLDNKDREAYEMLISRATGIVRADVRVVPESRAAIFSVFAMKKGAMIDATKGIAVFDFGSSTTDFTYLQMGKKRVEHSWTLGAARIEENLTRLSLERTKVNHSELSTNGIGKLPLAVRSDKEAYFNDGTDKLSAQAIEKVQHVNGKEERIQRGINQFTGKPLYDHVTVNVPINEETILFSIQGENPGDIDFDPKFCVRKDGKDDWKNAGWFEHCRDFFLAMKQELDAKGLPCETVVLTGGASKMSFVQTFWRETFANAKNKICDPVPALSVSIGLCYLANAEARMAEEMESMAQQLRLMVKNRINDRTRMICQQVAPYAYEKVLKIIKDLPDGEKFTVSFLKDTLSEAFRDDAKIKSIINECLGDKLTQEVLGQKKILAKRVMEHIFPGLEGMPDQNAPNEFAYTGASIDLKSNEFVDNLDLVSFGYKTAAWIANMTARLITLVIVGLVLYAIPVLGPIIAAISAEYLAGKVEQAILRYGNLKVSKKTLLKEWETKQDSLISAFKNQVNAEISQMLQQPECMGSDYELYLNQIVAETRKLIRIMSMQDFK